jgi:LAO/AO transport system kinase
VADVWRTVEEFRAALDGAGELAARRAGQARDWMWTEIADSLLDRLRADPEAARLAVELEAEVRAGRLPPTAAADQVLRVFLGGSSPV